MSSSLMGSRISLQAPSPTLGLKAPSRSNRGPVVPYLERQRRIVSRQASSEDATFRYPVKSGRPVEAHVSRTSHELYTVKITLDASSIPVEDAKPMLHWGMFRSGPHQWLHPKATVPEHSFLDEQTKAMRTPLGFQGTKYSMEFNVPASIAPVTLAFNSCGRPEGSNEDVYLELLSGQHCAVPVGMAPGCPQPLGASNVGQSKNEAAVNFAITSRAASSVSLVLVRDKSKHGEENSCLEVALDPVVNKTGDVWHVEMKGLDLQDLYYGWRVDGDSSWGGRARFFPACVVLDPYSRIVNGLNMPENTHLERDGSRAALLGSLDNGLDHAEVAAHSSPKVALESTVLYEIHVPSFTAASPLVQEERRGTILGILDRLPELQEIGVTTVVLSPLCTQMPGSGPGGRVPVNYFSPEASLAADGTAEGAAAELKQVVKSLHEVGMEVVLQFDFCFTAEGTDDDPEVISYRGIDNAMYYRESGVLNTGQVIVRHLLRDALRHWAREYCLDGFAVLNAETMCQDSNSRVLDSAPLIEIISMDPVLRCLKLLAYVGDNTLLPRNGERGFPHWGVWLQVNDRLATVAQRYMCHGGAPGLASAVATAVSGSPDLFAARWDADLPACLAAGRRPGYSANSFAPLMSGRTIMDLVTGTPSANVNNLSTAKALLIMQVLSQGTPMVSHADLESDQQLGSFLRGLLAFRRQHIDLLSPPKFDSPRNVQWFGAHSNSSPDWDGSNQDPDGGQVMGLYLSSTTPHRPSLYIVFNPHMSEVGAALPPASPSSGNASASESSARPAQQQPPKAWRVVLDTGLPSPRDFPSEAVLLTTPDMYVLKPCSAAVLVA